MSRDEVQRSTIDIGLLLIDGFALMSYASFIEPFRAANSLAGQPLYTWKHIAQSGTEAVASNGARIGADGQVGDPLACDMLFVFAAGDPAAFRDQACFAWLRSLARRGISLGGVSGGPYLLARAGLLNRHRATIHWEHAAALQTEFPDLNLVSALYVIDGDRMTCAGGTAGLDLALSLIERERGPSLANQVSEWFIRGEPRNPDLSQRSGMAARFGTTNRRLLSMLSAMEGALEEPLPREILAVEAGVSLRQLERLCVTHLGAGISETYLAIRLDRAAELLRSTGFSVTEIGIMCGFHSTAHFSRRLKDRFGKPPSMLRADTENPVSRRVVQA
ncbi:MAG TPA: GlxA family transcriptional regulator [Novosphingobium sp.]|nr:GlxA family transcriptional regulator [Novosphingobium sp.]